MQRKREESGCGRRWKALGEASADGQEQRLLLPLNRPPCLKALSPKLLFIPSNHSLRLCPRLRSCHKGCSCSRGKEAFQIPDPILFVSRAAPLSPRGRSGAASNGAVRELRHYSPSAQSDSRNSLRMSIYCVHIQLTAGMGILLQLQANTR